MVEDGAVRFQEADLDRDRLGVPADVEAGVAEIGAEAFAAERPVR